MWLLFPLEGAPGSLCKKLDEVHLIQLLAEKDPAWFLGFVVKSCLNFEFVILLDVNGSSRDVVL